MKKQKFDNPGDSISSTFCALPWTHLHNWPDGKVFPCCLTHLSKPLGNVKDNTLEEIWNKPRMKEIRKSLLQGKQHTNCNKCYEQEKNGIRSFRIAANNMFKDKLVELVENTDGTGHNSDFKLLYWDFRFSNLCNFKCRMCGSSLSSKWFEDELKAYGTTSTDKALVHVNDYSRKDILEYVNQFIEDVEEVYFAGGEPLLMEEHYMILQRLIEVGNTDCRIRYNTNFSNLKFKKYHIFDFWKHFTKKDKHNVKIFASIDAFGKVAEYSRKGTDWAKIEQNIIDTIEAGFVFDLSATVSILNIFHLPEFVDRMLEIGVPPSGIHMNNVLTFPDYYHINSLPSSLKKDVVTLFNKHLDSMPDNWVKDNFRDKYESILSYMNEPITRPITNIWEQLKNITQKLDKLRDEDFLSTYPQYKEWYDSIGTSNLVSYDSSTYLI